MLPSKLHPRTLIAITYDLSWAIAVWIVCFVFRYSFETDAFYWTTALKTLPVAVGIELGCFFGFGLYRGIWRYSSLHDLRNIALAIAMSAMLVPTVMLLWLWGAGVPRSVYVLNPLLLLLFMAGGRMVYRWFKEEWPLIDVRDQGRPVLLLAHDDASLLSLVNAFSRSHNWRCVGILADRGGAQGRALAGAPVLGRWEDLPAIAQEHGVGHVILSDSNIDHTTRRRAYALCESARAKLLLMPQVDDVMSGQVRILAIRDVELDDLLGRDPVDLDNAGIAQLLGGNVVLVTGAGGSIGSELCRQVARYDPSLLVMLDLNEYALYTIEQEFTRLYPRTPIRCVIADIKDRSRITQLFERYHPSVVFHAAAYKHVPMMEQENAWAAVANNALGTLRLAEVAGSCGAKKLVFISTDKAVNPTSVMGASKRLAERILQLWAQRSGVPIAIVRFGNVLGSTGSVIPKFKEQIARGGPVTVTHPEIRRYFMSVPEAVSLVLQSATMGASGEIFVLDMGEPVKIVDLARDLIRLSGLTEEQIRIEFTGLRPGEKLYEELLTDSETTMPTRHRKVRIAKPTESPTASWEQDVLRWLGQPVPVADAEVRQTLARLLPEYRPYDQAPNVIPLTAAKAS